VFSLTEIPMGLEEEHPELLFNEGFLLKFRYC